MIKPGDSVTVEVNGQVRPATILLASANERSLLVSFDGIVAGHVGLMPLLKDEDGEDGQYRSLGGEVTVMVRT
jgi:hypothetical protein